MPTLYSILPQTYILLLFFLLPSVCSCLLSSSLVVQQPQSCPVSWVQTVQSDELRISAKRPLKELLQSKRHWQSKRWEKMTSPKTKTAETHRVTKRNSKTASIEWWLHVPPDPPWHQKMCGVPDRDPAWSFLSRPAGWRHTAPEPIKTRERAASKKNSHFICEQMQHAALGVSWQINVHLASDSPVGGVPFP